MHTEIERVSCMERSEGCGATSEGWWEWEVGPTESARRAPPPGLVRRPGQPGQAERTGNGQTLSVVLVKVLQT